MTQRRNRPMVDLLIGDAGKAKKQLGWEPKVSFRELITMMVDSDLEEERQKLEGTKRKGDSSTFAVRR